MRVESSTTRKQQERLAVVLFVVESCDKHDRTTRPRAKTNA